MLSRLAPVRRIQRCGKYVKHISRQGYGRKGMPNGSGTVAICRLPQITGEGVFFFNVEGGAI